MSAEPEPILICAICKEPVLKASDAVIGQARVVHIACAESAPPPDA